MKLQLTKLLTLFLIGILASSCRKTVVFDQSNIDEYKGIDWVIVYQDDQSDTFPKDKVVYQTAWGNTPDNLKPKFDINFCKTNFHFPYYFPDKDQLKGKADLTITEIENEHLEPALQTNYSMTYNRNGKIVKYSISGPSTIYTCDFIYDNLNRIQQISDGWKKINITYNDFNNIKRIYETNSDGQTAKSLKFTYSYVVFQR